MSYINKVKTALTDAAPMVIDDQGLQENRVSTLCLMGAGNVTVTAVHSDNDPVTLIDGEDLPFGIKNIYGLGYTSFTITQNTASVTGFVTFNSDRS